MRIVVRDPSCSERECELRNKVALSAKLILHETALLVPAARIKPGCNRAAGMKQSHQGRIKMGGKKIPMPGGGGGA